MADEEGKQEEEKLEFTPEGETLGYISMEQARLLAMRSATESPGAYGRRFRRIPMALDVVAEEETEDYYMVTLSFRPQGIFSGTPGQEQFFIEKEGAVAHRQVLDLPRPDSQRRSPVVPVAIGLVVVGVAAVVGVVLFVGGSGGSDGSTVPPPTFPLVAPAAATQPATTLERSLRTNTEPTDLPSAGATAIAATPVSTPPTATAGISPAPEPLATSTPSPESTPSPTAVPVTSRLKVSGASLTVLGARPPVGLPSDEAQNRMVFQGLTGLSALVLSGPPAELHTETSDRPPRVRFQGLSHLFEQPLAPMPSALIRALQKVQ